MRSRISTFWVRMDRALVCVCVCRAIAHLACLPICSSYTIQTVHPSPASTMLARARCVCVCVAKGINWHVHMQLVIQHARPCFVLYKHKYSNTSISHTHTHTPRYVPIVYAVNTKQTCVCTQQNLHPLSTLCVTPISLGCLLVPTFASSPTHQIACTRTKKQRTEITIRSRHRTALCVCVRY